MATGLSLFVQYPNREAVLRELQLPPSLAELRNALEVLDDQQLQLQQNGKYCQVESVEQIYDGACLKVLVPRRRIFVSMDGRVRPVVWYPGATPEQIENTVVKACGLAPGSSVEFLDGDTAVVISPTIPNDTHLTVVPLGQRNGSRTERASPAERQASPKRGESPRRDVLSSRRVTASAPARNTLPSRGVGTASGGYPKRSTPGHPGPVVPRAQREATAPGSASGTLAGRGTSPARGAASLASLKTVPSAASDLQAQPPKVSAPEEHCVHILAGHNGFVQCLCTVGDVLFTGSQDCNIMIWDLNNLQYIGTLPGHRGFVKCMAASLSRKMLCSGSQDKTIKIWSLETFSSTKRLYGHTSEVNSLVLFEGSEVLVSGGEDRSVRVWDLNTLAMLASLEQAHLSGIFRVRQLDSGDSFITASRDRTMKVWLSSTWQARRTLAPPHYDGVSDVAVAGKKGCFFSASRDRSIRRWDCKTLESDLQLAHAQGDWLTALALSVSEEVLFSGGKDSIIKVWDGDLHCKDMLQGHRGPISDLLTIDNHLFSASHDRTVRVWKIDHFDT